MYFRTLVSVRSLSLDYSKSNALKIELCDQRRANPVLANRPTSEVPFDRDPWFLLRKEVIQPQVPLRLPCYDFIPITSHTFGTF
jgi:hypothetical protein